ncbi:MAG: 2-C-methyl-D-erythritol 2,4-cyclodiphosphate synthase [Planctomycetota bacterium]
MGTCGMRVGQGYDIHRLVEGLPMVIGGVTVEHHQGLLGHSNGDVLLHAITDALLGAAGLGDIGQHYPDTDDDLAGIDSMVILQQIVRKVTGAGWSIVNVDCTVVAQAPKLGPYREAMQTEVARGCGIEPAQVNVKMKTNEGLDAVGRTVAISSQAVVLLEACRVA